MFPIVQQQFQPPKLVPTKRSYKKLGTILEHISECIDPRQYRFAVQVTSHFPMGVMIYIETIPTPNVPQPITMCQMPWMDGSNGQIYINSCVLLHNADW